jgi:DNA-binding HxlR family transcriptional regulator
MSKNPARRQSPVRLDACNLAASFDLIGDRWSLLIVRSALYGVRRFDDFQAELDIPRTVLSDRLKKLIASGIMVRNDYKVAGSRARPEYVLSPKGEALRLPFLAMTQWADYYLAADRPKPLSLRHKKTGVPVRIGMVDETNVAVEADDVSILLADWALVK